jgi:hypothetical protein
MIIGGTYNLTDSFIIFLALPDIAYIGPAAPNARRRKRLGAVACGVLGPRTRKTSGGAIEKDAGRNNCHSPGSAALIVIPFAPQRAAQLQRRLARPDLFLR